MNTNYLFLCAWAALVYSCMVLHAAVEASTSPNPPYVQLFNKYLPIGTVAKSMQGVAIALSYSGDTVVVGSEEDGQLGAAFVFVRSAGDWDEQAKLMPSDPIVYVNKMGCSVAISDDGNTVAVGSCAENGRGAVWIFSRTGSTWTQQGPAIIADETTGSFPASAVSLSADGNTLLAGSYADNGLVGAGFIFVRNSGVWTQQQKITGAVTVGQSRQGDSVALSGDGNTAVLGGPKDRNPDNQQERGAAWVFTRSGSTWTEQAKLIISDPGGYLNTAQKLAISNDGNFLAISAPSAVFVFGRTGSTWTQQAKILPTGGVPSATEIAFGISVSMSRDGTVLAVGARNDDSQGAGFVFTRSETTWTQQSNGKVVGTGCIPPLCRMGTSIALSGDAATLAFGNDLDDRDVGASWAFIRTGGAWVQEAKLVAVSAATLAEFGHSVTVSRDGMYAAVGGLRDNDDIGAVWVYAKQLDGNWDLQTKLNSGDVSLAYSGEYAYSLAFDANGNTLAVTMALYDRVYIYTRSGATWTLQQFVTATPQPASHPSATQYPYVGYSVSLTADGNILAVGGLITTNLGVGSSTQGSAFIFKRAGNTWTQFQELRDICVEYNYGYGSTVAFSEDGSTLAVGCPQPSNLFIYTPNPTSSGFYTKPFDQPVTTGTSSVGSSLAISADGSIIFTGDVDYFEGSDHIGAGYIFVRNEVSGWNAPQRVVGRPALDDMNQGISVALSMDGSIAVLGGSGLDYKDIGAAWVFKRQPNGTYVQVGDAILGVDIVRGEQTLIPRKSRFGRSVAISGSGDNILVGAPGDETQGSFVSLDIATFAPSNAPTFSPSWSPTPPTSQRPSQSPSSRPSSSPTSSPSSSPTSITPPPNQTGDAALRVKVFSTWSLLVYFLVFLAF